jgi:hypothetical protein
MSGSQDCWIADDEETQFNTKVVIEELTLREQFTCLAPVCPL